MYVALNTTKAMWSGHRGALVIDRSAFTHAYTLRRRPEEDTSH